MRHPILTQQTEVNKYLPELDWDKILPENKKCIDKEGNQSTATEFLTKLKRKYPEICKFKYVMFAPCHDIPMSMQEYIAKHPEQCFDVLQNSWFFSDPTEPQFNSISVLAENFAYLRSYSLEQMQSFNFLLFSDKEEIKNTLFAKPDKLPAGKYELVRTSQGYKLRSIQLSISEDPILDDNILKSIKGDLSCLFHNKGFYEKNKIPYKRGIILYGPPGNGKTTLIKNIISQQDSSFYSILIDCATNWDAEAYSFLRSSLHIEMNKVFVFEDIDSISENNARRSSFLNFLDGAKVLENTFFIATTNYPEKVDPALINRPSRFDKKYYIGLPSVEIRKKFLLRFFPDLTEDLLNKYAKETDKFSGAYFKELFIMVGIQKTTIDDAIKSILKDIKLTSSGKFGGEYKAMGLAYDTEDF